MWMDIRFLSILVVIIPYSSPGSPEEEHGVRYATPCEVCKLMAREFEAGLKETGKTSDVLQLGHGLDSSKKKLVYKKSELRLQESLEGVCQRMLEYNIHKERTDSTRFEKGMSQTFEALHGLVNKGVKVELGIPYDLWDKPSAEVTHLKTQCETMVEEHEESIEEWYFSNQDETLVDYLCSKKILKNTDDECLTEVLQPKKNVKGETSKTEL